MNMQKLFVRLHKKYLHFSELCDIIHLLVVLLREETD